MFEHLFDYTINKTTNAYTAPQKVRVFENTDLVNQYLDTWLNGRDRVANKIIEKLRLRYNDDEKFYLATPASNDKIFMPFVIANVMSVFENCINISSNMSKRVDIKVGSNDNINMTEEEIRNNIIVDKEGIHKAKESDVFKLAILDDIYATGRSLRVCESIIKEILTEINSVYKLVILKTA